MNIPNYNFLNSKAFEAILRLPKIYIYLLVLGWLSLTSISISAQSLVPGQVLFHLNLDDAAQVAALKAQGAEIVSFPVRCLRITNNNNVQGHLIHLPLNIERVAGARIVVSGRIKAEKIEETKPGTPTNNYKGIKCQISYETPEGRRARDLDPLAGTLGWHDLGFAFGIDVGASKGTITIGLNNATGSVCYTDLQLTVLRSPVNTVVGPNAETALTKKHTERRGVMSPYTFNIKDFEDLRKWNVNLVRWQMNWPKEKLERDADWIEPLLFTLSQAIRAARANGIQIVIDLHSPPGGREPDATMRMVLQKKYHDQFIDIWQRIATRFKDNPTVYGYDLINEPVQNRPSPPGAYDWWQNEIDAAQAIRKIDPKTPIILEVDQWDLPDSYRWMSPPPVSNLIYEVHFYAPREFTNQGVSTDQGIAKDQNLKFGVRYPGMINGKLFDKEAMREVLKPVRNFQLAHNTRIYVGEFSAARWAPGADQWLEDLTSIFEEYGWDYTYHAFREWQGWDLELSDLPYDHKGGIPSATPTNRLKVMLKRFSLNKTSTSN